MHLHNSALGLILSSAPDLIIIIITTVKLVVWNIQFVGLCLIYFYTYSNVHYYNYIL